MINYKDLEKYFTLPVRMRVITGSFYGNIKIPRKLKKKVKKHCGIHWNLLSSGQKLWSYMEENNPDYKRFLIKMICKYYEQESYHRG
jgi:hypothetical protein